MYKNRVTFPEIVLFFWGGGWFSFEVGLFRKEKLQKISTTVSASHFSSTRPAVSFLNAFNAKLYPAR